MRSQVFQDFDAFAESVRDVDSKMLLRNPKRRIWRTASVDLGRINVQLGQLGSGNIAQGQLRPDGFILYLPLTKDVEYSANASVLKEKSFAILEPGCEFCISTQVEHDWCAAFVPSAMLGQDADPREPKSRSCRATRPFGQVTDQFRAVVIQILNTAANCSEFESSPAAMRAAEKVLHLVSSVVQPKNALDLIQEGRPKVPRQEIIRRSLELIEQRADKPVKVSELATVANVSERTLRTAFTEHFGEGPVRYLQRRKLHQVRRALKAADSDEVSVKQVLVAHGEWAFSRFASRYLRLFGELPSETLRRSNRSRTYFGRSRPETR